MTGDLLRLRRVKAWAETSLHDAATVNATRQALTAALQTAGCNVSPSMGGRTKCNRIRSGVFKTHAPIADYCGEMQHIVGGQRPSLLLKAPRLGVYCRTQKNKFVFLAAMGCGASWQTALPQETWTGLMSQK